jgi:hypothetical protein
MTSAQAQVFAAYLGSDNIIIDLTGSVPDLVSEVADWSLQP